MSLMAAGVVTIASQVAVHDHSLRAFFNFVLKYPGIKVARLNSTAVWQVTYQSYIDYSKFSPHKSAI